MPESKSESTTITLTLPRDYKEELESRAKEGGYYRDLNELLREQLRLLHVEGPEVFFRRSTKKS